MTIAVFEKYDFADVLRNSELFTWVSKSVVVTIVRADWNELSISSLPVLLDMQQWQQCLVSTYPQSKWALYQTTIQIMFFETFLCVQYNVTMRAHSRLHSECL